jgi:hypothetical protein
MSFKGLIARVLWFSLLLAITGCALAIGNKFPVQKSNPMGWHRGTVVHWEIDSDFNEEERLAINAACQDWALWTGAGIWCTTSVRNMGLFPYARDPDDFVVIKVSKADMEKLRGKDTAESLLGVTYNLYVPELGIRGSAILMVADNIDSRTGPNGWRYVMAHEFGHAFGFKHVDPEHERSNLMHANYDDRTDKGFGLDDEAQCKSIGLCLP